MKIYVGTSGWQYYSWYKNFYPHDLKSKDFLKFYSKHFLTVEINTSFYHFTKKETFEKWKREVPSNFLFAIKLHRLFTHFRRLKLNKEDKRILKETINSYKVLGKNLGPILIQLPPSLKKDLKLLKNFLKTLHNIRINLQENSQKNSRKSLTFAIEFRHKSWLDKEVYKVLKEKKIAFVISDSPRWPTDIIKTTDFVYVRFHGKPKLFASKYSFKELEDYYRKIKNLKPKIIFVYFNNDFEGYAVDNAFDFQKIIKND